MKVVLLLEKNLLSKGIELIFRSKFPQETICSQSNFHGIDLRNDVLIIDETYALTQLVELKGFQEKGLRIVLILKHLQHHDTLGMLKKNFTSYLLSTSDPEEVYFALHTVLNRQRYISQEISQLLLKMHVETKLNTTHKPNKLLSKRQWDVLDLLAKGMSNDEIATHLFISEKTVKNHISSILQSLNVQHRTSAVIKAFKNGWIPI